MKRRFACMRYLQWNESENAVSCNPVRSVMGARVRSGVDEGIFGTCEGGMPPRGDAGVEALRKVVLADLQRGMRLMLRVQDEIDPQFRFATPGGDVALAVTLPDDLAGKRAMFGRIRRFCAWKQVLGYTMTFNLAEPEALMTVGVSGAGAVGCIMRFAGEQGAYREADFEMPSWVLDASIDGELLSLLPRGAQELSSGDLDELEAWFGADGRYPAVHVMSGARGL